MLKDRRRATDAGVIGILLAHLRAFAFAEREGIFRDQRVYEVFFIVVWPMLFSLIFADV